MGAALRAVHRPRVSAIVRAAGAGPHLEGAIRSVLNQSVKDLEVLVVVERESAGEQVAVRLAARDRRVRVLRCDPDQDPGSDLDAALRRARGRLATIIDGGDALLAGAYQSMTRSLDLSGSDVVVARSRPLTSPAASRIRAAAPKAPRRGQRLAQVPEVVEDLVSGAVMAPPRLWALSKAGGATGSVRASLAVRALAVLVSGRRIDLLDQEVYTWRAGSAAVGASLEAAPEALLEEVGALAQMTVRAPAAVHRSLVVGRLGRDLVRLAARSRQEHPDFGGRLRSAARTVLPAAEDPLWESIELLDRVALWLLTRDEPARAEELEELLGRRAEDLVSVPLTLEKGALLPDPCLVRQIKVPGRLTEIRDVDLRLNVSTDTARWVGPRTLEVNGCAWVPGVDPSLTDLPVIEAVDEAGRGLARTEVERCEAPRADLEAGDPWRSYLASGITVRLTVRPDRTTWFRVVTRVAGRTVSAWMPQPAGSSRRRPGPPESGRCLVASGERGLLEVSPAETGNRGSAVPPQEQVAVVVTGALLSADATLVLTGTVAGAPEDLDIVLACSSARRTTPAALAPGNRWSVRLDLADPDVELGTYALLWRTGTGGALHRPLEGTCLAGHEVDGPATEVPVAPEPAGSRVVPGRGVVGGVTGRPARRARIITRRDGSVALAVIPPLTLQERSTRGRWVLVEREAPDLRPGVFLESFGGRRGGDNPAAICEDLAAHGVTVPLWWSVVDGTVPVPAGAVPVVVGSPEWTEALRGSRVIVTNDHLPQWFSKREGQRLLQTWHGTPVKRLLHDAAPGAVSLRYRRLMSRQVPQWDLLLAQNQEAGQRLKRALGYSGEVRVGEYPRNVRMLGGADLRRRVRRELGIGEERRTVLWAPTWREDLRHADVRGGRHGQLSSIWADAPALADRLDTVILMRSHHMNRTRPGKGMIDVSRYPSVEELMVAADVLVSDYSSIFFDFALTGKPAVIYAPDLEHYRDVERGLYDDWPRRSGRPVALEQERLASHLSRILGGADAATARKAPPEVDPSPILDNLAWIREWITRFLD
ncbi:glycosyltransferase [Actinomyces viscosus]|uniref:bifunctional glycosyltransferase/CDP-glycerol:glycerophosphate glycerophosphotransferase n=1 Tax=Actinomyces viscosus TaxID=1656 RepID=UPI000F84BEF2|nr:CDP-glycerol glycerophosphotransferase family protein [Actinomyces viscosus]TFH52057.1 glycosyltransferase [Actinomyces viscosus]